VEGAFAQGEKAIVFSSFDELDIPNDVIIEDNPKLQTPPGWGEIVRIGGSLIPSSSGFSGTSSSKAIRRSKISSAALPA
jgi:hypothetical protein